jgi:hypothetical protein
MFVGQIKDMTCEQRTTQVQVWCVSSGRKHQHVLCSAVATRRDIGGTENKNLERRKINQSDDYISYTTRRNMAELVVEHVWIKFRFHIAWGFGVGWHRYAKTVSSGREP